MTSAPPEPIRIEICGVTRAGAQAVLVGGQLTCVESPGLAWFALRGAAPGPR